jgi:hypothetical protein
MNTETLDQQVNANLPSRENRQSCVAGKQWEEVYRLCRLSEADIGLDEFKASPWRILKEQGQEAALESIRNGHLPLLPEQARIARKLREQWGE